VFQQILSAGRFTVATGETLDLSNYVVVATSNIGSRVLMESRSTDRETLIRRTVQAGTQEMRPETYARFDLHCVFNKLDCQTLNRIGQLHLDKCLELVNGQGHSIECQPGVVEHVQREGYSERFGARPIPGGQATFPGFRGSLTDLSVWQFIWTLQTVFVSGPPEGKHIELVPGFQFGRPLLHFADDGTLWIYNPFVQVTDVDRLGALGHFHWWGPYAQVGAQALTPGYGQPAATFNLFPVNLQYDVNDVLRLQLAAGIAGTLELNTGRVTAGPQVQFGLNFKLGRLRSEWLPPGPSR
jgi:hypothetical protein